MNVELLLIQIVAVLIYMHFWFIYAALKKRNDIADVAWGLGFVMLATIGLVANLNSRTIFVWVLVTFWGLRLASHIYKRFKRHDEEDRRYLNWRKDWGRIGCFGLGLRSL